MLPVLYSPYEPVCFLGFFTSWIRIRICPCGSGSGSRGKIFMRIRADPDPKHCFKPGMWVRINFFADPDPAVFLNADPDPAS